MAQHNGPLFDIKLIMLDATCHLLNNDSNEKQIFLGCEKQYAMSTLGKRKEHVFKTPNGHLAFNGIIDRQMKSFRYLLNGFT